MTYILRKRLIYLNRFVGEIKESDFQLITDELNIQLEPNGTLYWTNIFNDTLKTLQFSRNIM